MIASRDIDELHPKVAALCRAFVAEADRQGIDILITSTYRDAEAQDALFSQGRTRPGHIVTNARGGQSYHNWRVAFDFCPLKHGKCQWQDTELFKKCGRIAESIGLAWAGRWRGSLRELAHCQYTGGLLLADFREGRTLA